jgi:hypothetical protein
MSNIKVFLAVPFLSLAGKMFCVWIALELISFDPGCKRNPEIASNEKNA